MLNPGMRERHWRSLADKVGHSVQPNEMTTLLQLLEMKVGEHLQTIQDVSEHASKEYSLEKVSSRRMTPRRMTPRRITTTSANSLSPTRMISANRRSTR